MRFIICRGNIASGKSTFAQNYIQEHPGTVEVNRDTLRLLYSGKGEPFIRTERNRLISEALQSKQDIISSDTNLIESTFSGLMELGKKYNAEIVIKTFFDISLEECIKRDAARANSVGEKAIRNFAKYVNILKLSPPPSIPNNPALPNAFITDVDGTTCLYYGKNPYSRDFENDIPNLPVLKVLQSLKIADPDLKIIVVSGRNGKYKKVTEDWFDKYKVPYDLFFIRDEKDMRKDVIIKQEIFENYIKGKFNILGVFDDRLQVIKFWESLGLFVFSVNQGRIEF